MNIREEDLPKAGPWPTGINNLASEGSIPTDENGRPVALREADNVDLTREGRVRRRQGYQGSYSGTLVHSLWSDDGLSFGLFVDNGALQVLEEDGSTGTLGRAVGNLPLSYFLVGDRILFSNADACGMLLLPSRSVHEWGVAAPPPPTVEIVEGYGLVAGTYQIAFTTTDALGRESGASRTHQISVPEGSGLLVGPSASAQQPGDRVNVYLSAPNDSVLRLHDSNFGAGGLIGTQYEGVVLSTQLLDVMPAGQLCCVFNGVHWVADGRTLRWSPPFRYGMTDPAHNVIRFDARIDLMVAVPGQAPGIFIAAGKRTYWLDGAAAAAFNFVDVHSAGAVPGTHVKVKGQLIGLDDDSDYNVWLSRNGGYVIGMPGGRVVTLNSRSAAIDDADRGASMFVARAGVNQIVTALRGPRSQGLAVSDRAVAHVIHVDR